MSRSDWRGAAVRLLHLAAFAWLGPVSICLAADASSEMRQIRDAALTHYAEGRPVTASDTLRTALRAKADSLPQKELIVSYGFLADVCTSLRDPKCVMEATQGMRKAATKPLSPSDERFFFYLTTLTLHFANQLPANAPDLMEKVGPKNFDPVEESQRYVKMSFLAAQILVANDRPAAARTWLDAGLSVLLTSRNIGGYYVASYLVQAMKIMLDLGQYARADYYWRISNDFVRGTVPPTSVEALDLDWVIYLVGEQLGNKTLVEISARSGINTLERLEVPKHLENWYRDGFARGAAAICAIAGDWDCSDFFMTKHPLKDSADKLLNPTGQFQSSNAALFALISTMRDAFRGQELNASWKPAFESLAEEHVSTTTAKTYATWVLGLHEFQNKSPRFRQRFIDAARLKLRDIESKINAAPTVFWLPELYDRVILWTGALAASASPTPTQDEVELAVRAIEVGNRSLRHFGVDSFDTTSTTVEPQNQLQTQAVTQLLVRFSAWEKQRLLELVSEVGAQTSRGQSEETPDRLQYTIFVEQISALAQKVRKDARTSIPDLTDLQGLLDENEVLITRSRLEGATSFTCIRKREAKLVHHQVGGQDFLKQALIDLRVLNAALADERAPSDQLDSQFPFDAAQRVYRWLFEPVESSCLRDGDRVIWVDGSDATFPVHALSSNVPPGKNGFYDLAMAKWLGRTYAFSYVVSLSHFAAARRETRRGRFGTGYLGVGNPVLSGKTADGTATFGERIASRSARSATAGLVSLSQLPETEKEIQGLSRHFETNQSKVLLGPDATEANFRRQLLSEYGVIHFATHGVIGEELAGLTEPALVFTPVSERIQSNDGLLTASEISQLALRARLVVLSACNTANFAVSLFGNEFQGLSTAFLIAGSPTMMLTLWPVDSATSETVVGQAVSSAVESGMPIDKALSAALFQQAEKSGRKAYLHPRFWAPFVIFGDGSVTLAKRSDKLTRPRFTVQTFDAPEGGGELLSVVRVPMSDDIVMSGMSGIQDNRYKSLIQRVDPHGAVIWRQQDAKIAGGSVVVWGSSVLVSGNVSEGEPTKWIPTLSRYTLDGKLLWTKRLPVPDDAGVFAMSNDGGQDATVALSLTDKGRVGQARLLRIAGDGTVRRELDLPLPEKARASRAVIFHDGPNTIVHLSFALSNETGKVWRDRFSQTRLCDGEYGTARIVVSDSDDRVLETTYLSSTDFQSGLAIGGRRFLAGSTYDPCTFASSAKLSEDASVAARTVYSDLAATSSSLRALVGDSPTRLFGFGNSWTIVDPSRLSWTQNTGLRRLDEVMLEVASSQRSNYLLEVDPTTRKTKVYDFSAGVALHIAAATKVGDQLVAVGAIGGQPALLRVQLPPP